MQGRKLNVRWAFVIPVLALAAVVLVFLSRGNGAHPRRVGAIAHPTPVSETLGAREFRAPASQPATLLESVQAADALVKTGKLTPPPSLAESLRAADILAKAASIGPPTPPTLAESLQPADILANAGLITPPAPPSVPRLNDILHAAAIIAEVQSAPPPPATPRATSASAGSGGWYDDAFTAQVFAGVNQRRQNAGLQPLAVEPHLANAAATYAKVLADTNTFSHTGPDGSTLVTRTEAAGFPFTVQIGEVLAWGSNGWTPAEIVQAWMDSPAHHEQIMSAIYTRAGAGCYFTNSGGTQMVRCAMELAAG